MKYETQITFLYTSVQSKAVYLKVKIKIKYTKKNYEIYKNKNKIQNKKYFCTPLYRVTLFT